VKQYYYKINDCKALHATDAECICWHDEGTGPFPGHRIGVHTCHLRDKPEANKMISDTPRTDAAYFKPHSTMYDLAGEMKRIERELNVATDRIKRLELVINDPHALWLNWLRGTVTLPVGIGDVRQYQDRIKRLEEAGDAMEPWCSNCQIRLNWHKAKEAKP
jgi:hypothetical protein